MDSLGRIIRMVSIVVLCAASAVPDVGASDSTFAAAFLVTNLDDSGPGSLRQAILNANATPGGDTISVSANGQLNLASALPTITDTVTIIAPGFNLFQIFKVDGQNLYRGFTIASVPVTITGLTVQHAAALGTLPGGGIASDGDLTLNSVKMLNNTAGSLGGGVSSTGSVVVNGGLYQGNSSGDGGGAIYAGVALVANGSTIRDNQCTTLFFCNGGGLYAGNRLTLTNTQIISNTAQRFGGGAYALGAAQVSGGNFEQNLSVNNVGGGLFANDALAITGTLFISNTAANAGGGGAAVFGSADMTNARFENNRSLSGDGGGGLLA